MANKPPYVASVGRKTKMISLHKDDQAKIHTQMKNLIHGFDTIDIKTNEFTVKDILSEVNYRFIYKPTGKVFEVKAVGVNTVKVYNLCFDIGDKSKTVDEYLKEVLGRTPINRISSTGWMLFKSLMIVFRYHVQVLLASQDKKVKHNDKNHTYPGYYESIVTNMFMFIHKVALEEGLQVDRQENQLIIKQHLGRKRKPNSKEFANEYLYISVNIPFVRVVNGGCNTNFALDGFDMTFRVNGRGGDRFKLRPFSYITTDVALPDSKLLSRILNGKLYNYIHYLERDKKNLVINWVILMATKRELKFLIHTTEELIKSYNIVKHCEATVVKRSDKDAVIKISYVDSKTNINHPLLSFNYRGVKEKINVNTYDDFKRIDFTPIKIPIEILLS